MRRASVTALIAFGIAASSWQGWGADSPAESWVEPDQFDVSASSPNGLLATQTALVSAGPPGLDAGATASPPSGVVPAQLEPNDATVMAIRTYLETRHTALSTRDRDLLAETIVVEARRHQLDPWLVLAVIQVESQCYHLAVSPVGAIGLMQLLPATAQEVAMRRGVAWHGADTLYDPVANVKLGTAYLKHLSRRFGSISTALAAYNWGPGRIRSRLRNGSGVPSLYISQVMKAYERNPQRIASAS